MRTEGYATLSVLALLCLLPREAHAYLDPGAGSMILQLILGGVGGLVVLVKLYWRQIVHLFVRRSQEPEQLQLSTVEEDAPLVVEKEKLAPSSE